MKIQEKIYLLFLFLISTTKCDLPVHCVKHELVGQWIFQITQPILYDNPHQNNCGHKEPDDAEDSNIAGLDQFVTYQSQVITLNPDYTVIDKHGKTGTWTMIYDEGFEVILGSERYTTFLYYESIPGTKKHISYCGRTTIGWYHNEQTNKYACFKGDKILKPGEISKKTLDSDMNLHIVSPMLIEKQSNWKNLRSFDYFEKLELKGDFMDHAKVVKRLNEVEKSWTAHVPSKFAGLTLKGINYLVGRKSFKPTISKSKISLLQMQGPSSDTSNNDNLYTPIDVSDLPKHFEWGPEVIGPIRDQKDCGSCYILSTTNMIAARLKIKHNEDVMISVQHPLDCAYYNQGCEGGYPYLVSKFGAENEFVPESCHPYKGKDGKCSDSCDIKSLEKIYKVKNYNYVGGAFGKSNERNMMIELMNNGPISVSFEPNYDFSYYSHGIYESVPMAAWMKEGENQPEWEKVDHAVLLIGWGEENGKKYWKIKNSWGKDWGENGTFRMARGIDESAIESMAEYADPYIVYSCNSPKRLLMAAQGDEDYTDECF